MALKQPDYIRITMNSKIPIIALTADVIPTDLEKCIASGMNDYISKPVEDDLLYSKMISLVENTFCEIKQYISCSSDNFCMI